MAIASSHLYIYIQIKSIISQRNDTIFIKKNHNNIKKKCNQHNQWNLLYMQQKLKKKKEVGKTKTKRKEIKVSVLE